MSKGSKYVGGQEEGTMTKTKQKAKQNLKKSKDRTTNSYINTNGHKCSGKFWHNSNSEKFKYSTCIVK